MARMALARVARIVRLNRHAIAVRMSLGRWRARTIEPVLLHAAADCSRSQARLPEPKEAAISRFRAALEHHGIGTSSWWQQQLDLCMIGIMAAFGWEKALGDASELSWWEATVAAAAARQRIPVPG